MTQPPYGGPSPYQPKGPDRNRLPVLLAGLAALVGLAIAVVIVVVGRSGADDSQASGGSQGNTSQATQSTQSTQGAKSDGSSSSKKSGSGDSDGSSSTSADLPKDFPVPDGVDISGYDDGSEYSGLTTVSDPQTAYDFWVDKLPKAGYTIDDKSKTGSGDGFIAQITFSGNGLGSSTISFLGTTCAIQLKDK